MARRPREDSRRLERWDDEQLLRAAQDGDELAYRVFCVRTLPTLHRYLQMKCKEMAIPVHHADDFAQETILKALEQISSSRLGAGHPFPKVSKAWLLQIGFNLARDWLRKHRKQTQFSDSKFELEVSHQAQQDREKYEEVLEFFNWLIPDHREILELVLIKSMSPAEAAFELEITSDAAYKRYERALQQLRDLMEEHGANRIS